jgi:hypothetical protein
LSPGLALGIAFLLGLGLGILTRSWWALTITILEPILFLPGYLVGWLIGTGPPLLSAGVATAVVASVGCAAGIHAATRR